MARKFTINNKRLESGRFEMIVSHFRVNSDSMTDIGQGLPIPVGH